MLGSNSHARAVAVAAVAAGVALGLRRGLTGGDLLCLAPLLALAIMRLIAS
jgi:hypothetical protein